MMSMGCLFFFVFLLVFFSLELMKSRCKSEDTLMANNKLSLKFF
jgi:hypothetical protein